MALSTMYSAKSNSPETTIAIGISAADTTITLVDATVLPPAPNICTLGDNENAEVISYTTITGNVLSGIVRGISGTTASVWPVGTIVARDFTSYDHDTFIGNINDLNTRKADTSDVTDALALKADLASPALTGTPTAPTAAAGTNTTQIATTAYVQGELGSQILYYTEQAVSVANNAQIMRIPSSSSDSSITTDTIVLECAFAAPSNLTDKVFWTSYNGYIVFTGTCTAATTANVTLGKKGN